MHLGKESHGCQGNFLKRWGTKNLSLSSGILNLSVERFLTSVGNREMFTLNDKVKKKLKKQETEHSSVI